MSVTACVELHVPMTALPVFCCVLQLLITPRVHACQALKIKLWIHGYSESATTVFQRAVSEHKVSKYLVTKGLI